jgi:hypothetical protein
MDEFFFFFEMDMVKEIVSQNFNKKWVVHNLNDMFKRWVIHNFFKKITFEIEG